MINKIEKYRYASMPQENINKLFLEACQSGNLELVDFFLTGNGIKNAQIEYKKYDCIFKACYGKHLNVLDYLLTSKKLEKHPSIDINNGNLLNIAFENHDINTIDYLLDFSKSKRIDLDKRGESIFKSLMGNFTRNKDMIQLLVIKYNIKKTQNIIDYLDEKNRGIEEKKIVNDWFNKRDLKITLDYVFPKKDSHEKVKKLKI